ncbi:MAG: 3-hydroxyisobutyrate dehydrogenase [Candidatus Marinimicrobia bacterium]|nr:3-hydroxyisobutyrate dehydrogenase [Candidatus Neomarinimicrobiota bacterium]
MATIAFIGLGNMGQPMAKNQLSAGRTVRVFDLSAEAVKAMTDAGGQAAKSPAEAAEGADAVITMLPAGKHVKQVYIDGGVIDAVGKGAILIDCSTIDVLSARDVIADAGAKGVLMVDAPVSGGVAASEAGTLTFMVGGSDAAFAAARPFLGAMGKTIVHAGPAGNGQVAKVCNNMLLGISMIGTCETFALGEKLGIDPKVLFEISSKASGQCWSMTSYCPVPGIVATAPSNQDYKPGFSAAMMLKDLLLSQEAALTAGATTPMGRVATEIYEKFVESGNGGVDFSGVIREL